MTFLQRKRKVNQLYRVKTEIKPSCNIGTWSEPRYVTYYFLAKEKDGKYYELFSGEFLEFKKESSNSGVLDVPYIVEVEPMSQFSSKEEMTDSELFYYIVKTNAINDAKQLQ